MPRSTPGCGLPTKPLHCPKIQNVGIQVIQRGPAHGVHLVRKHTARWGDWSDSQLRNRRFLTEYRHLTAFFRSHSLSRGWNKLLRTRKLPVHHVEPWGQGEEATPGPGSFIISMGGGPSQWGIWYPLQGGDGFSAMDLTSPRNHFQPVSVLWPRSQQKRKSQLLTDAITPNQCKGCPLVSKQAPYIYVDFSAG